MKIIRMLLFLGIVSAHAEPIDQQGKVAFVDFYRNWAKIAEEFPEKQEVKAIFVDLDGDGKEEALATYHGNFYEVGWSWNAFRQTGNDWAPIRGFNSHTNAVDPSSSIFARPGEIFRVILDDGATEFLVLNENFDKLAPESLGPLNKTRLWIGKDKILRQDKIEALEKYLAYRGPRRSGLIQRLEVLKVEIFDVKK